MSPPEHVVLAALASLPAMGPRRLHALLAHHSPEEAFAVVLGRAAPSVALRRHASADVLAAWRAAAARLDLQEVAAGLTRTGVAVLRAGDTGFPSELAADPAPPAVLFARGTLDALDRRRVGIVGTRNATRSGIDTARALGRDLAAAGVAVVSGLALGVDGAAHVGALTAGGAHAVAVVGSGPDVAYPKRHASLWEAVCANGLLLSEWPPGTRPDPFRFPMRNRILAALCDVVVVVESREAGGSLLTAMEALERSIPVMAVPGSPRNRAAAGTNRLIADGAAPCLDAGDVLVALGLTSATRAGGRADARRRPRGVEVDVLERCREAACTLGDLATDLGLDLTEAALALARLERSGWLVEAGGWFEAVGPPADVT